MFRPMSLVPVVLFTTLIVTLAVAPSQGVEFIRGDADQSGNVNVSDAIVVLQFTFQPDGATLCADALDVDDNGAIDMADGIAVMMYLFLEGSPPPAPFPTCGEETSEDTLGCESHAACVPLTTI